MIKALEIKESKNTPHVWYVSSENTLNFAGRSFPENARKFYDPIQNWLAETFASGQPLIFHFELMYISSASLIAVLDLLKLGEKQLNHGGKVSVVWTYDNDDEEMRKVGEDYSRILTLPFTFVQS